MEEVGSYIDALESFALAFWLLLACFMTYCSCFTVLRIHCWLLYTLQGRPSLRLSSKVPHGSHWIPLSLPTVSRICIFWRVRYCLVFYSRNYSESAYQFYLKQQILYSNLGFFSLWIPRTYFSLKWEICETMKLTYLSISTLPDIPN